MRRSVPLIDWTGGGTCPKAAVIMLLVLTVSLSFLIPPPTSAEQPSSKFKKLLKQAEREDAIAQGDLGLMYYNGKEVRQGLQRGAEVLQEIGRAG